MRHRLGSQDRSGRGAPAVLRRGVLVRFAGVLVSALVALSLPLGVSPASAASVSSASFVGDSKTLVVDGVLFAKKQAALTLSVTTTAAKCVEVLGDHVARQTSNAAKTAWSFGFTAGDGNGVKSVTVRAFDNAGTPCTNGTGSHRSLDASYTLDNTAPVASATLSPAANPAGWNNSLPVTVMWDAADAGVGFSKDCDGSDKTLNPCSASVTSVTNGTTNTASATDRLGNAASPAGSVTVKVDTAVPTITGTRTPTQPTSGWNNTDVTVNFTCEDPKQGVTKDNPGFASGMTATCGPNQTVSTDGAAQSVLGKGIDVAGNEASATVGNINVDKTPPVVTGAATTPANGDGWYNGDVTVAWTCSDPLSGLATACPGNSTITGEGRDLGVTSASVSDRAGNSRSGSVSGINIDRKAPNTTATAPADWNNTDVTVQLNASDALSGVKHTYYRLNGGASQTGTSVAINSEGSHTLEYWSVDRAGNEETRKTVEVKIDKTDPTINHSQDPAANANGWNNSAVTVTFVCNDNEGGSGIKSCTAPQTVAGEGANQQVTGTAVDNAGNTATDPAMVSIDTTPPTISAATDRDANGNGWYKDDVTVGFTCVDALSGIDTCPQPATLGEGANQSVSGTATDAAGNSASANRSGINVDKTSPTLTGAAQGSPTNGWYSGDVTVTWTCSDAGSGIDGGCPADSTVNGEGDDLRIGASVSDRAGNSTNATVGGIKIDRTAPVTRFSVPAPSHGTWHARSVEVTLTATDNLSQTDTTYYTVNGGAAQLYTGPFTLNTSGTHSIVFWSVDKAGNVENKDEAGHSATVDVDNTPPSIQASINPDTPNGLNGWYVGAPTVSFACDDLGGSGIASCLANGETTNSKTLGEGPNQSVSGTATDSVGISATTSIGGINVDLTDPSDIKFEGGPAEGAQYPSGSVPSQPTCTATDATSGVASCEVTGYSTEVGTHTLTATATDQAGRKATATRTYTVQAPPPPPPSNAAPSATMTSPTEGALVKLGTAVSIGANYTDDGTGHTCTIRSDGANVAATVTPGSGGGTCTGTTTPNAAGVYNVALTVTDSGGLSTQATTYFVVYDPNGGFVTGGGWINSPAGAYTADSALTGKANFGFVSKYQKGATAPTGQTEFHFQAGNFRFTSTSYEWLVVSGPKAQYKGAGTVNGVSGYSFMLTVTDGQVAGGGGVDKFRIKITGPNGVVYDNVPGQGDDLKTSDPQAIAGGSIVIHAK